MFAFSDYLYVQSVCPLAGEDFKSAVMGAFRKIGISKVFFNGEELDYIINYDVKYRMGVSAGEEDSDE